MAICASAGEGLGGGSATLGVGGGASLGTGVGSTAAGAAACGTAAHSSALTPAGSWLRQDTPKANAITRPMCASTASAVPRPRPPGRCGISASRRDSVLSSAI